MVRELLTKSRLPLQIGFVVLLAAIVVRVAYLRWDEVRALQVTLHPAWVGAGGALAMLFTFGLSLNWQWLVRHLSPSASQLPALVLHKVFLTSFLTRYLPAGAIVNIGGKVELLRRQGSSLSVGLESVLYELVFLMGGGLFLAWVAFAVEPAPWLLGRWQSLYPILMTAVAVGWVLCFSVPDRLLLWGRALVKRGDAGGPHCEAHLGGPRCGVCALHRGQPGPGDGDAVHGARGVSGPSPGSGGDAAHVSRRTPLPAWSGRQRPSLQAASGCARPPLPSWSSRGCRWSRS